MKTTGENFPELAYTLVRIRDLNILLETVLKRTRGMLGADSASLFIYDGEKDELIFKHTQNDSVQLPFMEFSFPLNETSMAGFAAVRRKALLIKDVYHPEEDYPFGFNSGFDKMSGYRTKSVMLVPVTDLNERLIGVLQFTNKKRYEVPLTAENVARTVIPFGEADLLIIESLCGVIGLALENALIYNNTEKMTEGLITELTKALEHREPPMAGRLNRVTAISEIIAAEMHRDLDIFPDFFMNRLREKILRISCRLQDVGKIFVSDRLFTKNEKLFDNDLSNIETRFKLAKACARLNDMPQTLINEFDRLLYIIKEANISDISDKIVEDLEKCRNYSFEDSDGEEVRLLTDAEFELLSVREGIYCKNEQKAMRSHALHAYSLLRSIEWTSELEDIPVIVAGCTEKLDGSGYPFGTTDADIHIFSKIIAAANFYDSLTAGDNSKAETQIPADVLSVMVKEAENGGLDKKIVQFLYDKETYRKF